MAKTTKITREELQRDELAEGLIDLYQKIQRNWRTIVLVAAVIVLAAVAALWFQSSARNRREDANRMFANAQSEASKIVQARDDNERKQGIDSTLQTIDALIQAYPNSQAAREALYLKGKSLYAVGRYEDAAKAYREFIARAPSNEDRAAGEIGLGYALENSSFFIPDAKKADRVAKLNEALAHYGEASKQMPAPSYLYYYALMSQARVNELMGKDAEAIRLYNIVVRDRPSPVEAAPEATPKPGETSRRNAILEMAKEEIREMDKQLSFAATARLRLERLQGEAAAPTTQSATTEK